MKKESALAAEGISSGKLHIHFYNPLVKLALKLHAMNDLVHSCNAAPTYPKNLISSGEYQHTLQNYVRQLDEHDTQLFEVEAQAALDFWELHDGLASTSSQLAT